MKTARELRQALLQQPSNRATQIKSTATPAASHLLLSRERVAAANVRVHIDYAYIYIHVTTMIGRSQHPIASNSVHSDNV